VRHARFRFSETRIDDLDTLILTVSLPDWTFSDNSNLFDNRHLKIFVPCLMVSKKRSLEDASSPKAKKSKPAADGSTDKKEKRTKAKVGKPLEHTLNVVPEEADDLFKVQCGYNASCMHPCLYSA
jgi:hypothetical protein